MKLKTILFIVLLMLIFFIGVLFSPFNYPFLKWEIGIFEIISLLINILLVVLITFIYNKYFSEKGTEKEIIIDSLKSIRKNLTSLKNITIQMLRTVRISNVDGSFVIDHNFSNSLGYSYLDIQRSCIDDLYYLRSLVEKSHFNDKSKNKLFKYCEDLENFLMNHLIINREIRSFPDNDSLAEFDKKIIESFWHFNLMISECVFKVNQI